jgi:tetratricopeptide (TPR) repeat protein
MDTGRNQPCPCGSGRKYKHCHGRVPASPAPTAPVPTASPAGVSPTGAPDALRAVALLRSGRAAEAEAEAERLLAREPLLGAAWACLGFARMQQGKDAVPALRAAARALPQDATVQHVLGQVLEERGLLAQGAECLERAVALRPDFTEAHNDLGRVRLALGDVAGAAASCRRAIELRPDFAAAHGNLANAERARGDIDAAIAGYQRVMALEPDNATALEELGASLVAANRAGEALPYLERLVALRPEATILSDFATLLVSLGRYAEAVRHYRAAIERSPKDARLHSNLAHALHCGGDFRGAINAGRRSLALDDRLPEAYLHLGNALMALSEVPQAEACYRDALTFVADHQPLLTAHAMSLRALGRIEEAETTARRALAVRPAPDVLTLLGNLATDRGHFAEAADHYQQALALAPELPEALVGVSRTRRMTAMDGAWRAAAEKALTRGIPVTHAVNLYHALGKYHEDLGESEAAFAAHASGNALARSTVPAYDRAATASRIDAIVAAYDRPKLDALAGAGAGVPSDRPVFVVGMPRSGTTLVEQILASHPAVYGADELLFWNLAADQVSAAPASERAGTIARLGAEYLAQLARRTSTAARVIDKLPGNFENIGLIHAALPDAKFIHLERDPRDTCVSIFFQGFTAAHAYSTDLEDLAHYYREYRRLMAHWRMTLPVGSLLDVPYEALVADPETWTRRMLAHIGLPWDARCLDFHRTERSVLTASAWQVRQPLNTASVGRWQNYERFLGPLIRELGDATSAAAR